ncbi:alpha/beta fold hydrolase [Bacillus tuaregi]|uniref:alpha/beta fold hydrolase n=1 Tax=Bacillus tuaregi TaxID=1816695 RepID=UPI0008F82468|nr:alpha/beta fold hydrolase [Bacillus tuaregi]
MFIIEKKSVNDIPVLHLAKKNLFHDRLPLVLFMHGFTSAKENNLHYAYLLAEKGFRVVLPEAMYHGERQVNMSKEKLMVHFWDIVLQSIDEIEVLRQYYFSENLIDPDRIGLVGTSMGGIITLGSLTRYKWIKAAVSLMGMPYYEKYALLQINEIKKRGLKLPFNEEQLASLLKKLIELDLSRQPKKLEQRPLLFWHGKQDPIVPFSYTYDFYERIKPLYEENPKKLQFIIDEKSGHKVSREGVLKTVEWFETYLA